MSENWGPKRWGNSGSYNLHVPKPGFRTFVLGSLAQVAILRTKQAETPVLATSSKEEPSTCVFRDSACICWGQY